MPSAAPDSDSGHDRGVVTRGLPASTLLSPEQAYQQGYRDALDQQDVDGWARATSCAAGLGRILDRLDTIEPLPHLIVEDDEPVYDHESTMRVVSAGNAIRSLILEARSC